MAEYPRYHIGCNGQLTYAKTIIETIVLNKKAVDKFHAKAKIKQIEKEYYICDKCKALVNIISFPSYEQYVLMGKIRVTKQEYLRLKEKYATKKQNQEKSDND